MTSERTPNPVDSGLSRHPVSEAPSRIAANGRIRVYSERFEVYLDARRLDLTLVQYRILSLMARRPGWVFTPEQIVSGLRAEGVRVESTALKNYIYQIRRRFGTHDGELIETVRGVGYRLADRAPGELDEQVEL